MDISKISPDTIVTEEMLNPQTWERLLIIEHYKKQNENIIKGTEIEIEAYRTYYKIKHKDKVILRAMVTYSDLSKHFCDQEFLLDYEPIEILKKEV